MKKLQILIFGICLIVFTFLIIPFLDQLAEQNYAKFYELEGTFEVEYFRPERYSSVICFKENKKYRFRSKEDHKLGSIIKKGDKILKVAKEPYFDLVKSNGETTRFLYQIPD